MTAAVNRSSPCFVLDGLYLGGIEEAHDRSTLEKIGVTHILTVESRPLTKEHAAGFTTKFVHALDMDSENLLCHFDECITFIEEGRAAGGVLVHCVSGESRSVAIVLAYYMKKMQLPMDDALDIIRKSRPQVGPNDGFQEQLQLFEQMGHQVDPSHSAYKLYKLNLLSQQIQITQASLSVPSDVLGADPSLDKSKLSEVYYKCGKCRRPLFMAKNRMTHTMGSGGQFHRHRHHGNHKATGEQEDQPECTKSLFIEPVKWMADDILQMTGKLNCPKCKSKLGSFTWAGEQCPCGRWVIPAFHIQGSKVDFVKPGTVPMPVRVAGPTAGRTIPNLQVMTSVPSTQESSHGTHSAAADVASLIEEDMAKLKT